MKTFLSVLILSSLLFSQSVTDQVFKDRGEIYFRFSVSHQSLINTYTDIVSIDKVAGLYVYAYANKGEFNKFLLTNTKYEILTSPGELINPEMSDNLNEILEWDVYPTYDAYVTMMNQFAVNYPSLCKIVEAGNTTQGRKILFAKISDNVNVREAEPQFMYSSSIHGDETTGYILMLRLIDSLLTGYASNPRITNMVNNMEIWINPLANPDGTYKGGNNTVNGAIRGNANYIDMNRNFPDPQNGPHPDGNAWQAETIIMMNLAGANNFSHSANFHGGTEVVNYPWDTWATLHADNTWWMFISHLYADTCQANAPSGYMNGYNDGITNGYAWYEVNGGRQDYFTYFRHGREATIEISDTKLLPPSQLPAHWNYNKKSFLTYMEDCLYGIRGIVTDTLGNPVKAFVKITGHDFDSSEVFSHPLTGDYYRMIAPGTYSLTFSAPGFYTQTISNIQVQNFQATTVNIELIPDGTPVELISFTASARLNNVILNWETSTETNNKGFEVERKQINGEWSLLEFVPGNGTTTELHSYTFADEKVPAGKYAYRLKQIDYDGSFNYSKENEIEISNNSFVLLQNYPNPFNPLTTIQYQLPANDLVSLKVYDILGNEAASLLNQVQNAGSYEIQFDGSSLASGIYYYQLRSGNYVETKKLVLLK